MILQPSLRYSQNSVSDQDYKHFRTFKPGDYAIVNKKIVKITAMRSEREKLSGAIFCFFSFYYLDDKSKHTFEIDSSFMEQLNQSVATILFSKYKTK